MEISKIDRVDLDTIHRVLSSNKISEGEKTEFLNRNSVQINEILDKKISSKEYENMMQNRPLKKFKPLKNSYTKRGDKILLAKTLEIEPSQVESYIKEASDKINIAENVSDLKSSEYDTMQTYVFRHGTKEQVLTFLDYELSTAKDLLKELYSTLKYNTNGLADYYSRPIHRMNNSELIKIYGIVDNHLTLARENGQINDIQKEETAEWALTKIYQIQNNSKLRNAIKLYGSL